MRFSNISLSKYISYSILHMNDYIHKIKHKSIYSLLKTPYKGLRIMLENGTVTYSKNEEMSDYKKHISLIILISIIIAGLIVLISSLFLIKFIYKKCKKKKEEEEN